MRRYDAELFDLLSEMECFRKYSEIIKKFLYKWQRIFTEDFGTFGSLTAQKTGEFCGKMNARFVPFLIKLL